MTTVRASKFWTIFGSVLVTQALAAASACNPDNIEMKVVSVHRRVNCPGNSNNGILRVLFINRGKSKVEIPFVRLSGLGEVPLGDIARLEYNWHDGRNNLILTKTSDVVSHYLILSPEGCQSIDVPVSIPEIAGRFRVRLTFDNSKLVAIRAASASMDNGCYFSKSVESLVDLPPLPQ